MRVLRSGAKTKLKLGLAALAACGAMWFLCFRAQPKSWQLLAKGKLLKIEAERAIYKKSNSPDYFVRVRVSNLSSQVVGFDRYENVRVTSRLGQPLQVNCQLVEGDHPAPVNGMTQIFLESEAKTLEQAALLKYRAKKLPIIAPGAAREFFIVEPNAKTQIAQSWKSCPLWWKSKIFLPNDNLRSPYIVVLLNGQLTATDGKSAQWFGFQKKYLALKFPVKTKFLP